MRLFYRIFLDHPATVSESYWEHLRSAIGFSGRMFVGGGACLIHALVPCVFVRTGSRHVTWLYDAMVTNRVAGPKEESLPVPDETSSS